MDAQNPQTAKPTIGSLFAGIRWLSGSERLKIMGFGADWMRRTLQRLGLPATPSVRKSHNGLPKN